MEAISFIIQIQYNNTNIIQILLVRRKIFSKLGNITHIFASFSWDVFCHMTLLDQSRGRING